jgi:hypothetical protein
MRRAVNSPNKPKAIPYRPRRAALNWVDYLVIAATALTFLVVVAVNRQAVSKVVQVAKSVLDLLPLISA